MRKRKPIRQRVMSAFLAALTTASIPASSFAADIYFVYSGKDKGLVQEMTRRVPTSLTAKTYNIDLLALADYSGKQKVTAKLKRADFILFVNEKARAPFESSFDNDPTSYVVTEHENIEQILKTISTQ